MESTQNNIETVLVHDLSSLTVQDSPTTTNHLQEIQVPPHRSHNPENNPKRSDPFQFGSRLLSEEDNVYEFNAWDHVETDDAYKEYAEEQFAKQRQAPVSDFDKSKNSLSLCFPLDGLTTVLPDDLKMHSSSEAIAHERNNISNVFRSYLTLHFYPTFLWTNLQAFS
jgi:hypothetical protein